jgi:two-component system chemotaxis sensor kinase CheA
VRQAVRLPASALRAAGEREELQVDRETIPYAALHRFLPAGPGATRAPARHVTAVILRGAAGAAALGVDRLLGVSEAVVRPLPALADALYVAGASPGANGSPRLLLDAQALAAAVSRSPPERTPAAPRRRPILVVDDSLTTRMLEQSILESAGYTVDIAVSGEDALIRLREKQYGLMLVDLEMPGMDGFTVIEHVRRDPALRLLPAILVTSRESREDRQRGLAAGANDYFIKGDFDQRRLLQRIAELLA